VIDDPRFSLDALAGVRGFYADNILSVLANLNRSHAVDFGASKSWAAPMAGVHARVNFTDRFYATGSAFVGGTAIHRRILPGICSAVSATTSTIGSRLSWGIEP
jgi:hypothetical protein